MPDEIQKPNRGDALKAWHDAKNVDERKAAVKQHPVLVEIFAIAAEYVEKPETK